MLSSYGACIVCQSMFIFTVLAQTALVQGTCTTATTSWPDDHAIQQRGISGSVTIDQDNSGPAMFTVKLSGLTPQTLHGIHIHQNPVTLSMVQSPSDGQVAQTCATCGGHFNPYSISHGSFLNALRGNTVNTNTKFSTQDWEDAEVQSKKHHVGDLINNVMSDSDGKVNVVFYDPLATLLPTKYGADKTSTYTILGRSIVIHASTDDLGRQGSFSVSPPFVNGIGKNSIYSTCNRF